mgnify:CR=1 FL=1
MATVDWQPFQGKDLPKYGFTAEIARQALARKGHTFDLKFMPWARAVEEVKAGKYHALFNPWKGTDNEKSYYFSKEIMGSGDGHFLALADSKLHNLGPDGLKGMRIGFVRAYSVSDELSALFKSGDVKRTEVEKVNQLIKMIRAGRIDIILENQLVAQHVFKTHYPKQNFDLKIVGKDLIDGSLYIGWSKKKFGSKKLRDDFDAAIGEMRNDGTIEKIMEEFGVN